MTMKRLSLIVTFIVLSISGVQTAWTEKKILSFFEESNDPIKIESEQSIARIIPEGYESIFLTNVRVTQGFLSLKCTQLTLIFSQSKTKGSTATRNQTNSMSNSLDFGNLRSANAIGNVIVKYKDTMAASDKLAYDHAKRTIIFSGNAQKALPKMWQGSNLLVGKTITINLDTNVVKVTEPEVILTPNQKKKVVK
jgi:lipopolysaccharide export system protein LptA